MPLLKRIFHDESTGLTGELEDGKLVALDVPKPDIYGMRISHTSVIPDSLKEMAREDDDYFYQIGKIHTHSPFQDDHAEIPYNRFELRSNNTG